MPSGFTWLGRFQCVYFVSSFITAFNLKYLTCNVIISYIRTVVDTIPGTLTCDSPAEPFCRFSI